MKIAILGPAHPYRGGLASIMEIMARTFQRRGDEVDIKTFTLQYPSLLFPGESQMVVYFADTKRRVGARVSLDSRMLMELQRLLGNENVVVK